MIVEPIGLLAFCVGLLCLASGPTAAIRALVFASLLQSAAAFILVSLGGASVQPGHLLLLFTAASLLRRPGVAGGALRAALPPAPGFWLVLLLVYGLVTAIVMPRLFAGLTYTFGNVRDGGTAGPMLLPLGPTSGNLTQTVYIGGNVVCFLLVAGFARTLDRVRAVADALLACACLNLAFALLDLVTYATGTVELLSPIRNASYGLLDDAAVMGIKRIVGSFPEASTYAFVTLGLFGFALSLWLRHYRPLYTGLLALALLASLMLSTSSTAYAGSIGYLGLVYLGAFVRFLRGGATRNMARFVLAAPVGALAFLMLLRFSDGAWRVAGEVLDSFLFNKLNTASGIERALWNRQALDNFFDTYGLGAGLGSVRSSSFVTSVLGNTGVVGAVAFLGFLVPMLIRPGGGRGDPEANRLRDSAASGCLAFVLSASISGGAIDLGLLFCVLSGVACAKPAADEKAGASALRASPLLPGRHVPNGRAAAA